MPSQDDPIIVFVLIIRWTNHIVVGVHCVALLVQDVVIVDADEVELCCGPGCFFEARVRASCFFRSESDWRPFFERYFPIIPNTDGARLVVRHTLCFVRRASHIRVLWASHIAASFAG